MNNALAKSYLEPSIGVDGLQAKLLRAAPALAERAIEIERLGRLPTDIVENLKDIGVFRMFAPRSHNGLELPYPDINNVIRTLARIDGSIGWTAMIGSMSAIYAALLPRELYDVIYRGGPDIIVAGSVQPLGVALPEQADWRVTGRWPFASGCDHADWLLGTCILTKSGQPDPSEVRYFVFPKSHWTLEDTWRVSGLRGTGSKHIALSDAKVPKENFIDPKNLRSCLPGPLYQSVGHFLPLSHAAVSLGIAQGALDDLLELANRGRRPSGPQQEFKPSTPLRQSETFQGELGKIHADVRAAAALLNEQIAAHWSHALAGTLNTEKQRSEGAQTARWISLACLEVANTCVALGGSAAIYEDSPIQRRLRDLRVAAQHANAQQRHYIAAGLNILSEVA